MTIPFKTPDGVRSLFLGPKSTTTVPDSWTSKVLTNLVKRRMARVVFVDDPPVVPAPPRALKSTRRKEEGTRKKEVR